MKMSCWEHPYYEDSLTHNPLSSHGALKHHFTSLKTDLIFLQLRDFRGKMSMKLFYRYKSRIATAIHDLWWIKMTMVEGLKRCRSQETYKVDPRLTKGLNITIGYIPYIWKKTYSGLPYIHYNSIPVSLSILSSLQVAGTCTTHPGHTLIDAMFFTTKPGRCGALCIAACKRSQQHNVPTA